MLKAVLFDMDDTLCDWSQRSIEWIEFERQHLELVFNYIARDVHPLSVPDVFYDAARFFAKQAWTSAESDLLAPNLGTVLTQALEWIGVPSERIDMEACLRAYDWQPIAGVIPYADAIEVLPILIQNGLKVGVVTNAYQPMWMRDRELAAWGLLPHFPDCRLSAADVGYLKPHKAIFEAALERLHVRPEEAIFVGDNLEADIGGAQGAGMRALLRVRDNTTLEGNVVPNGVIMNLHEMLPILDNWFPGWRKTQPESLESSAPETVNNEGKL
jgi:putative hydrolase of the HAD superfamily